MSILKIRNIANIANIANGLLDADDCQIDRKGFLFHRCSFNESGLPVEDSCIRCSIYEQAHLLGFVKLLIGFCASRAFFF